MMQTMKIILRRLCLTKKGDGLVKRKKVMCVFYNKEVDDFKIYNKFMDILDENKKILKPLYY